MVTEMFEKKAMRLLTVTRTMASIRQGIEGGLKGALHGQEMAYRLNSDSLDERMIKAIKQASTEAMIKFSDEMCAAIGTEIADGVAELINEDLIDRVIEIFESPTMQEYMDLSPALFAHVIPKHEELNTRFVPLVNEYVMKRVEELMA